MPANFPALPRPGSAILAVLLLVAAHPAAVRGEPPQSLAQARRGFQTHLLPQTAAREPVEPAPAKLFRTVKYPAPAGNLAAYVSPAPGDGKKHPAIVWITGGDCNSIGDVWHPGPRENEQTASAYRKAGIVMMFPSLRGGNDNPGTKEGFLGEVDDVLAAASYLAGLPYVDPQRIYLGGHSTGGTLALLVSECSPRFRAAFAFGGVEDVSLYDPRNGFAPFDPANPREALLRSPGRWLGSIQSPTWVLEGTEGNIESLRAMAKASTNPQVHCVEISGRDHFATLAPTNELLARKILADTGETCQIILTPQEIDQLAAR